MPFFYFLALAFAGHIHSSSHGPRAELTDIWESSVQSAFGFAIIECTGGCEMYASILFLPFAVSLFFPTLILGHASFRPLFILLRSFFFAVESLGNFTCWLHAAGVMISKLKYVSIDRCRF